MAKLQLIKSGYPLGMAALKKFLGRSSRYDFLSFYATGADGLVTLFDDFANKALNATNDWTVAAGAGATTWARTVGTATGSTFIRGVSGATAATSGLQLRGDLADWFGTLNCGIEVKYRSSVVTELRLEVGFANAVPAVNTTMINSLTTPTFNTTVQAAAWVYDNATAVTTMGLYTIGTTPAAAKAASTVGAPTAATWQVVRVETRGTYAYAFVDGVQVAKADTVDAVTAATAMVPFVMFKDSDTTTRNIDIDYMRVWQERA